MTRSEPSIQRDFGLELGDWVIKPTVPGETDERYDNPQNRERAERQDEDSRGYSPTPDEWWKPKTPDYSLPMPQLRPPGVSPPETPYMPEFKPGGPAPGIEPLPDLPPPSPSPYLTWPLVPPMF